MRFPGDATERELEQAFAHLRETSVARWGEARTTAIESVLRDAGAAIVRLDRVRFAREDAPGFYLHETLPEFPRE